MKPRALMDFRALRSLSVLRPRGPWLATEFGSAGPTGSPSASYNDPTQPWQERLSVPPQSLSTRNLVARALLTAGGTVECRAAGVATLVERSRSTLVSSAHSTRAFLLASATAATLGPRSALMRRAQPLRASSLHCLSAERAPWIRSVRR